NGSHFDLYDTSGPYTDDHAHIDVHEGLPAVRRDWALPPVAGANSQLAHAKAGTITPEMRLVAAREDMDPEFVRNEVAIGRPVIAVNRNPPESEPTIIGKKFLVKNNANIGNSAVTSSGPKRSRRWSGRPGGVPTPSWICPPASASTRPVNASSATHRCLSVPFRSTRPWRRLMVTPPH